MLKQTCLALGILTESFSWDDALVAITHHLSPMQSHPPERALFSQPPDNHIQFQEPASGSIMDIDRRALLLGTASLTLGLRPVPVPAEPLATAAFALSATDFVLGMIQGSDGLIKEIEAIHLKLDAILANQMALAAAISAVDQRISDLMQIVLDIPRETLGLALLVDTLDVLKNLAEAAKNLQAGQDDGDYEGIRRDFFALASRIQSITQYVTTPSVAAAAWYSINGLAVIARAELPQDGRRARSALQDLRRALEAITSSQSMVSTRLEETRRRIAAAEERALVGPTSFLLSKELFAVDPAETPGQELSTPTETPCFKGPHGSEMIGREFLQMPEMERFEYRRPRTNSVSKWWRLTTEWRRVPVEVVRRYAFGGRPKLWLAVSPPEAWTTGVASRERNEPVTPDLRQQPDRTVSGFEKLAGCHDLPLDQAKLPVDLDRVRRELEVRNSLVEIESVLLAHLDRCRRGLNRLTVIEERLT